MQKQTARTSQARRRFDAASCGPRANPIGSCRTFRYRFDQREGIQGTRTGLTLPEGGILPPAGNVRSRPSGEDQPAEHRRPHVELQAESIRLRVGDHSVGADSINVKRPDLKAVQADRDA